MRIPILATIVAFVFIAALSQPADAKTLRLKIGAEANASHPVGASLAYFAAKVEKDSGGEIKVATFPGEALGKAREMVEMVQLGTLDMATITAGVVSNFAPGLDFFSLPFLWQDQDHIQRAVDGELGDMLQAELDKAGLYALGFSTSGARQLYTNATINGIDDVKGLKVRTMKVPQIVETWKNLGAIPVPVAWGEVYQALQTGLVDAAESSFLGWISQKHYEQAKFGYRINYIDSGRIYFMGKALAEKLDPEQLEIIENAMQDTIRTQILEEYRRQDAAAGETAQKYGAKVIALDVTPFRQAVKPVYEKFKPSLGPKVLELVEAARQ